MIKMKNHHIFNDPIIVMVDLYGWAMSQNLPVNNFEWIKILLDLMKIS